jgi:Skp family chaperone for outer membrane proteins
MIKVKSLFAASLIGLLAMGCTRHPTPEELAILEDQIRAADSAEKRVEDLKQEKASLEAELQRQQKILADHEAEFEEIKRRMQERGK